MLMDNLNGEYNPCTQLYSYVCSKWSDKHADNVDNYDSVLSMINYESNLEIKEYLENTRMEDMPRYEQIAKNLYESCMKDNFEFNYLKRIQWLEQEENMKWALLTPVDDKDVVFDWTTTMAIFRKYGFNDMFVEQWRFKTWYKYINSYKMKLFKKELPLPSGAMDFMELWPLIQGFEQKLRNIKGQEAQTYKFHELPYPWLRKYLTTLAKPKQLDANMKLTIDNVAGMDKLDELIKQYDEAFLCRYLEIRFLLYLDWFNLFRKAGDCMTPVTIYLTKATESIYMKLHPELLLELPRIQQMFEDIKKNLNKTLDMNKVYMVPRQFFTTLEQMKLQVGDTYSTNSTERLEAHYKDLNLHADDYYINLFKILKFINKPKLEDDDSDKKIFYTASTLFPPYWTVSPMYKDAQNVVTVPFGLLRTPFYNAAYADIFKLSSLGSMMTDCILESLIFMGFVSKHDPDMNGIHPSYEIFFSFLQPEDIERYTNMFTMTSVEQLQQLFFINEMHTYCERTNYRIDGVNAMRMADLDEAFQCNFNRL
ncbi:uncharacterized protein [Musca autumnalis]|uniref:uncharacterized protein n=1 Tax=Musca autumnalis TaxID=221902 RepID=UPI003CF0BA21